MAAGLQGDIGFFLKANYFGANDLAKVLADLGINDTDHVEPATTSGLYYDKLFADTITLAASGNQTLDLTSGMVDPFGVALVFAKIGGIYIKASSANTNSVIVGVAASNAFDGPMGGTTPTQTIPPGGKLLWTHPGAGWTVDSSHKSLKLANSSSGTGVDLNIVIWGKSA